ncbi:MAG: HAMP domain-containing sensor histidine kinase [Sneathiella sp.]
MSGFYLVFSLSWAIGLLLLSVHFFRTSKKIPAAETPIQLIGFGFLGLFIGTLLLIFRVNPILISTFNFSTEILHLHYLSIISYTVGFISLVGGILKLFKYIHEHHFLAEKITTLQEKLSHQNELLAEQSRDLEIRTIDYLEQREAAIEADRSKTDFLRNASHEVRTPINAIIGLSELIAEGNVKDEDELKEFAGMVIDSGRKLLTIFETLLEIARIKSDEYVANPQPANIREVIDECVALCLPKAHAKDIRFQHLPEKDEGISAIFDKKATYQILIRLIGNALTYSPELTTITIEIDQSDHYFTQIRISDEGPGIEPSKIKDAFELFGRVESWQNRGNDSTGLGLALSVKMANIQNAKLQIESDGKSGTTCILSLPSLKQDRLKAV